MFGHREGKQFGGGETPERLSPAGSKAPSTDFPTVRPAKGSPQGEPEVPPARYPPAGVSPTLCLELDWAQQEGEEGQ